MKVYSKEEVSRKINMEKVLDAIELAYIALREGRVTLPNRMFMDTRDGGDFLLGPSYIKDSGYFGAKVSAYTPDNKNSKVNGAYILFNDRDGCINSIFDSEILTAHRTAAKSAIAAKYLADRDSKSLGVLGMGTQALLHIKYFAKIFKIDLVKVWTRNIDLHRDFVNVINNDLGIQVKVLDPKDVVKGVDIVIDATYASEPLVDVEDINNANFVLGINHSPNAVEFDESLIKSCSKVYVDFEQNLHAGTLKNAIEKGVITVDDIIELKYVIGDEFMVRDSDSIKNKKKRVYFQSGGVSIEDLACAISLVN